MTTFMWFRGVPLYKDKLLSPLAMFLLKSNLLPLVLSCLSLLLSIIALMVAVSKRKVKYVSPNSYPCKPEDWGSYGVSGINKAAKTPESDTLRDSTRVISTSSGGVLTASIQATTHTTESTPSSRQVKEEEPKVQPIPIAVEPQSSIAEEVKPSTTKRYSPIPEDNRIKAYDIQLDGEGDSFIEIDFPADPGVGSASYRFNVKTNHQFIISQGIDRLDNAFAFNKPTSQRVNKILALADGTLVKDADIWKIDQKAKIEFN